MKFFKAGQQILLTIIIVLGVSLSGFGDTRFFSLSEIKPGMAGEGYTVFRGTKVESFPVEVVDVLTGTGTVPYLILIKMTGEQFPGIASGMSGTPVFINKKLVGAIGYGFQNADLRYAMVTPIQNM